eukprot:scaffold326_cov165-Amphora_coffeaeformis.AAC.9
MKRTSLYIYVFVLGSFLSPSLAFVLRPLVSHGAIRARPTTTAATTTWQPPSVLSALPPATDLVYSQDAYIVARDTLKNIAIFGACLVGLAGLAGGLLRIVLPIFLASVGEVIGNDYPEFWQEQAVPLMATEGSIRENPNVFFTVVTKLLESEEPEVWEKCVAGKLKPGETLSDRFDVAMAVLDELDRIDKEMDKEIEEFSEGEVKKKEDQSS